MNFSYQFPHIASWNGHLNNLLCIGLVVLAGLNSAWNAQAQLPGDFVPIEIEAPGLLESAIALGDYDGDGDLDILLNGDTGEFPVSLLIANTDSGFVQTNDLFQITHTGDVTWADIDGDNQLDALVGGQDGGGENVIFHSKLYRNTGAGFEECGELPGLVAGAYAWADADNDGDMDLAATGRDNNRNATTLILLNKGSCVFEPSADSLLGVFRSHVTWSDYDLDEDLDLFIVGRDSNRAKTAVLYQNNGGSFNAIETNITPVDLGWADWGDYDSDGDPDLFVNGKGDSSRTATLYNNENGVFTDSGLSFEGTEFGKGKFIDLEADASLGIVYSGRDNEDSLRTYYYFRSLGSKVIDETLPGTQFSDLAAGDLNGDETPEVVISGSNGSEKLSAVYRNTFPARGVSPYEPGNVQAELFDGGVRFQWSEGGDEITPSNSNGLTYNLRVGTTPGGHEVMPAMAYNTEFKGVRLIPARGNVGQNLSWTLRGINVQPGDTLYWGVQTINRAFTPSRFVESELVFINVSSEAVGESINDVHLHTFPNPSRGHPTIQFSLDSAGWVQVRVYDMLGREVMSLVDAFYTAGSHTVTPGQDQLAAGIYSYVLTTEENMFSTTSVVF